MKRRANRVQYRTLVDYVLQNNAMANVMEPSVQGDWERLTNILNERGLKKSCPDWKRAFNLLARRARHKSNSLKEGKIMNEEFTVMEKKLLKIDEDRLIANGGDIEGEVLEDIKPFSSDNAIGKTYFHPSVSHNSSTTRRRLRSRSSSFQSTSSNQSTLETNGTPNKTHEDPTIKEFQESLERSSENLCNAIDAHGDKMLEGFRLLSNALMAALKR